MVKAVKQNGSQHVSSIKSGIIQRIALGNCFFKVNKLHKKPTAILGRCVSVAGRWLPE